MASRKEQGSTDSDRLAKLNVNYGSFKALDESGRVENGGEAWRAGTQEVEKMEEGEDEERTLSELKAALEAALSDHDTSDNDDNAAVGQDDGDDDRDEVASDVTISSTSTDASTISSDDETRSTIGVSSRLSILCLLGLVEYLSGAALCIMAPFYTSEAAKKGLSVTRSSAVFATVFILQVVFTPLFGKYIRKLGAVRLLVAGSIMSGLANLGLGFVNMIDSVEVFFVVSLLMRSMTAVGESAINISVYPLARRMAPKGYTVTVLSCMETTYGLGNMTGSFLGGLLFNIGGFLLPFLVCGILLVIFGIGSGSLISLLSRQSESEEAEEGELDENANLPDKKAQPNIKFRSLIQKPSVLLTCFIVLLTGMSTLWYEPTLEPHLSSQYNLNPFQASLFLIVDGTMYAFFSPVWGLLLDRKFVNNRVILLLGCLIISASFLLLGPVCFPINPSLYQIGISLAIHGIGQAANFIGTLTLLCSEIEKGALVDPEQSQAMATSMWITFECIGSFLGSFLGGLSYEHMGWRMSSTLIGGIQFFGALICILYRCITLCCKQPWISSWYEGYLGEMATNCSENNQPGADKD